MMSGLIGIGLGTILSKPIYTMLFNPMSSVFPILTKYPFLFYAICFVLILIACHLLAVAIHTLLNFTGLGVFNTFIGVALGFVRGGILCLFIIIPITIINPELIDESMLKDIKPVLLKSTDTLLKSEFFENVFSSYNEIKSTIK